MSRPSFVAVLNEWTQKNQVPAPVYMSSQPLGTFFTSTVTFEVSKLPVTFSSLGQFTSKKASKESAAEVALQALSLSNSHAIQKPNISLSNYPSSSQPDASQSQSNASQSQPDASQSSLLLQPITNLSLDGNASSINNDLMYQNPVGRLNEYTQKHGLPTPRYDIFPCGSFLFKGSVSLKLQNSSAERTYETAEALKSKKEVKVRAALIACRDIFSDKPSALTSAGVVSRCSDLEEGEIRPPSSSSQESLKRKHVDPVIGTETGSPSKKSSLLFGDSNIEAKETSADESDDVEKELNEWCRQRSLDLPEYTLFNSGSNPPPYRVKVRVKFNKTLYPLVSDPFLNEAAARRNAAMKAKTFSEGFYAKRYKSSSPQNL